MEPPMSTIRVFSDKEKQELADQVFIESSLDLVDLVSADLRGARFRSVSLRGADLRGADLRGAQFVDCDMREACLRDVRLGDNRFDGSCLHGATGLSEDQKTYISTRGGDVPAADTSSRR
jgi:uncharacterized protein YjbI with pentapeptide repeats